MKHCPICNRSSAETRFFGELCEEHAAKRLSAKLPKEVEVVVCRDCGRIKVAGKFVPESKENVQRLLESNYRPYALKLLHSGNGIARIVVIDRVQEGLQVEHNAHLLVKRVLCDDDNRKRGGYYEAVVQFRGSAEKVARAVASLQRYIEKEGAFVARTEEKEHGIDVYVSSKSVALAYLTVRRIKWKGSFELHGEKRGKRLYRNTYFVTL